jgi:mandelamide amidase
VPSKDALVAEKLRDAGAIIIGKANMHELALGISGYNGAFKTGSEYGVRNAYDSSRIAGGSSSGTAAAIGTRIVTAGLGTDTGGSVRIPCALNGCASLRPTVGRYVQTGIAPISHTRDTAGPMAATMADVALLDRIIAGGGTIAPANLKEVRIGVEKAMLANLDGDTDAAFRASLDKLKAAGVTVIDVQMPKLGDLNGQVGFPVALYEAYDDMVAYLKHTGTGVTIEELAKQIASPDVKVTYDGLVIPRKLPGPNNTVVDAKPAYDAAVETARPALQALRRARHSGPGGARSFLQIAGRSRARRPCGKRPQVARDRHGPRQGVRAAARTLGALTAAPSDSEATSRRRRCGGVPPRDARSLA